MSVHYQQLRQRIGARRLETSLIVSRQFRYAYMSNPKAACSSIKLFLARCETGDPRFKPSSVHDRRCLPQPTLAELTDDEREGLFTKDFFRFTFVRHPLSRVISAYEDKIRGNRPQKREVLEYLGRDPEALDQDVSFDDFLSALAEQDPATLNPHWKPQTLNLAPDLFAYHFVGKQERFDEDFEYVKQQLHLPDYRRVTRNRKVAKLDRPVTPTRRQRLLVSRIYADDFDRFGYRTDRIETVGVLARRFRRAAGRVLRRHG